MSPYRFLTSLTALSIVLMLGRPVAGNTGQAAPQAAQPNGVEGPWAPASAWDADAAPPPELADVADPRYPAWVTTYGTQLGRLLVQPAAPDGIAAAEGPLLPLTGTWLTPTIEPGNRDVKAMAYAPDGRIFVALNGDGLRVYSPTANTDYAWSALRITNSGLTSNSVSSLAVQNGDLWIGTNGGGIVIHDLATSAWTTLTVANSGVPSNQINRLRAGRTGTNYMWAATNGGAVKISPARPGYSYDVINTVDGLNSNTALDVAEVTQGGLNYTYIAVEPPTSGALGLWRYISNTLTSVAPGPADGCYSASLTGFRTPRIEGDRNGALWMTTYGYVVALGRQDGTDAATAGSWQPYGVCALTHPGSSNVWTQYNTATPGLPSNEAVDFSQDYAGRMWMSFADGAAACTTTCGGGAVHDKGNWDIFRKPTSPLFRTGGTGVLAADEGVYWSWYLSSTLTYYSPNWLRIPSSQLLGNPSTVYVDITRTLVGSGPNLAIYSGTAWSLHTLSGSINPVKAIASAGPDRWWIGTGGSGLYEYNLNAPAPILTRTTTAQGLPSDNISALAVDGQDRLWVGTPDSGLAFRTPSYWLTFTTSSAPILSNAVSALALDGLGRLWVGSPGAGISVYALGAGGGWLSHTAPALPANTITGIARGPDGRMWVATSAGVAAWNPATNTFTRYDAGNGALPNNATTGVTIDPQGRVWVTTQNGVALFAQDRWSWHFPPGSTLARGLVSSASSDGERAWFVAGSEVAVRGVFTKPIGNAAPTLTSFTPLVGAPGTVITLTGTNYDDTDANKNIVQFFPSQKAQVLSASTTKLVVKVPPLARTGTISVKVGNLQATSGAAFQLKPRITGLSASCGIPGTQVDIFGEGFQDGGPALLSIGGATRVADATSPTKLTTFVRPGDQYGPITVQLVNGQSTASADSYKVVGVKVADVAIQQAIAGEQLIWGKKTAVIVQPYLDDVCSGTALTGGLLDWQLTNGTRQYSDYWQSDAGLPLDFVPPDPSPNQSVAFVTDWNFTIFPLSSFAGMSFTLSNNHIPVVTGTIAASAFKWRDTRAAERRIVAMRVTHSDPDKRSADFTQNYYDGLMEVSRMYPQQDASPIGSADSWMYLSSAWVNNDLVNFDDAGNWGDVRSEVEAYLKPSDKYWAVALVDPAVYTSTGTAGRGSEGWRTMLAVNQAGMSGRYMGHEMLHGWGFVSPGAANYQSASGGADKHSRYDEGQWVDNDLSDQGVSNCDSTRKFRAAIAAQAGPSKQVLRIIGTQPPIALDLGGCGWTYVDLPGTDKDGNYWYPFAKSLISYAPGRENRNVLLEPLDYRTLLKKICDNGPCVDQAASVSREALQASATVTAARTLRLQGKISSLNLVTTTVSQVEEAGGELTASQSGAPYRLQVFGFANVKLVDQRFDVPFEKLDPHEIGLARGTAIASPQHAPSGYDVGTFSLRVPFPAGSVSARIVHDGVMIWDATVSAHAPTVTLTSPNGGIFSSASSVPIQWSAGDLDPDVLKFAVEYSADGIEWLPILMNATATAFSWSPDGLVPPSATARVRVIASDGFNTAVSTSNPFQLAPAAPQALIVNPKAGEVHGEGSTIDVSGGSFADGQFNVGTFSWRLDGATVAGTRNATVTLGAPGVHTLTLMVTANALTGTRSVTLTVMADFDKDTLPNEWEQKYAFNPLDPLDAASDVDNDGLTNIQEFMRATNPRVADTDNDGQSDGFEVAHGTDPRNPLDKFPVQAVLNVGAEVLKITHVKSDPAPDPVKFWVTNGGPGTINWTASEATPWLSTSPVSGTTASEVQIDVTPQLQAVGEYTGVLTFTGNGALSSPRLVTVSLTVIDAPSRALLPLMTR